MILQGFWESWNSCAVVLEAREIVLWEEHARKCNGAHSSPGVLRAALCVGRLPIGKLIHRHVLYPPSTTPRELRCVDVACYNLEHTMGYYKVFESVSYKKEGARFW